jgi:alpha-L-fucosidase
VCNSRHANYLLNVAPDRSGLIPDWGVARLREIGQLRDAASARETCGPSAAGSGDPCGACRSVFQREFDPPQKFC